MGNKIVQSQAWQNYFKKENELKAKYASEGMEELEADFKAWEDMKPFQPDEPEEHECVECEGRGTIPTAEGLELLRFIRKYI